jgi:DNA polymerase III sliding clamp (beta) subunit (PCNA family)
MKIAKQCKILEAVSTDSTRYVLVAPYLDIEEKAVISTDGRILSRVPCEVESDDVTGHIAPTAFKEAVKRSVTDHVFLRCGEKEHQSVDGTIKRPDLGKFPDWKQVMPKAPEKEFKVKLDVFLLHRLAQALGAKKVKNGAKMGFITLTFDAADALTPVSITASNGPEGNLGILMPVRIK